MSSLQTDLMLASSFTHRSFLNSDIQTILSRPLLTHLSVYLNVSKRGEATLTNGIYICFNQSKIWFRLFAICQRIDLRIHEFSTFSVRNGTRLFDLWIQFCDEEKNAFSSRTREVKSFSPWFFSHPLLLSLFSILTYFSSSLSPISQMLKANFSSSPLIRRDLILCILHVRTFLLKYLRHDIAL